MEFSTWRDDDLAKNAGVTECLFFFLIQKSLLFYQTQYYFFKEREGVKNTLKLNQ